MHSRCCHWGFFWKKQFKFKSPSLKEGVWGASHGHMKITGVALLWFCFNAGTGSTSKCWVSLVILWGTPAVLSDPKFSLRSSPWLRSAHLLLFSCSRLITTSAPLNHHEDLFVK